jgi:hypothetical protein
MNVMLRARMLTVVLFLVPKWPIARPQSAIAAPAPARSEIRGPQSREDAESEVMLDACSTATASVKYVLSARSSFRSPHSNRQHSGRLHVRAAAAVERPLID